MKPARHLRTLIPNLACACVAVGALTAPAAAHEFWLASSNPIPATGDTVSIRAFVGTGFRGDKRPWLPERAVRFESSDREDAIRPDARETARDSTWVRVVARAAGTVVSYESNFIAIELPAAEFDRYLADEGLDGPLRARALRGTDAGPGRERYRRSCKAWIAGSDTVQLARPGAYPLELLALSDPLSGRPLRIRVVALGKPLAGALVRAWRQPLDAGGRPADPALRSPVLPSAQSRTDAAGEAVLALPGGGEWLVSAVQMLPSQRPEDADWESTWASLTFSRSQIGEPNRRAGTGE